MDNGIPTYERLLLRRAAEFDDCPQLEQLTHARLIALTDERGIDFATAVLYDRVRKSPRCVPVASYRQANELRDGAPAWAIVPGAFYRERNDTGAAGQALQALAARLGIRCEVVPLASFGDVAHNADLLARWLADHRDETWTLISLSKGSLEVRQLLERAEAETLFEPVKSWVTLSGLVSGSPLVSWMMRRPLRTMGVRSLLWWRGYDFSVVRQLDRTAQRVEHALPLPHALEAVHVVGFPLRHQLSSSLMRRGHRRLSVHGPNDGAGVILADVVNWPGLIYPLWGADHYLRTGELDMTSAVAGVLQYLTARDAARRTPIEGLPLETTR